MKKNLKEKTTETSKKQFRFFLAGILTMVAMVLPAFAAGDYGQNAGTWALDQLFWVGIVIVAVIVIREMLRKNVTGLVVTLVIGGIVLFVIKAPDKLATIGETLFNVVTFGG
ncbi:MAG: TcpD family membrane protein [Pygmaiobacter massiliensis]|uniref:TcpD family membrane protein n=1 Tax=Pygmaiobacter massiliensis TaxID=1917873 RepID=UPI00289A39EF|nr:TcpD family membrane protein [Pygmaiobacter massiliensis]MDD3202690.1 TcpD family membrane protein [Pygmaiobacter massiliensis]